MGSPNPKAGWDRRPARWTDTLKHRSHPFLNVIFGIDPSLGKSKSFLLVEIKCQNVYFSYLTHPLGGSKSVRRTWPGQ